MLRCFSHELRCHLSYRFPPGSSPTVHPVRLCQEHHALLFLSKDDLHCQLVRLLVSRRVDQAFVSAWHSSAGMQKAAPDFWARETASHRREGWGVGEGGGGHKKRVWAVLQLIVQQSGWERREASEWRAVANSGEGDMSDRDVDKRTKYEEEVGKGSHSAVQSCILKFYPTSRLNHAVGTTKLIKLACRMGRFLNPVN